MNTPAAIHHIVWDWNGTLLDDNPVMLASVNAVCAHFGRPAIDIETWRAALCRPLWRCYGKVLDRDLSAPEDWGVVERVYHEAYRRNLVHCRTASDAEETLALAQERGLTQSLLSMGLHHDVIDQAERFGVSGRLVRVDGVKGAVAGGHKADHLQAHLDALGLDPRTCALIGDVTDDAAAARAMGAECVLVTTGMTGRPELEATGHTVADSLAEALDRIVQGVFTPTAALPQTVTAD
ncbi:HAD family hydrolase [Streptomyces aureoverticillatus]|uniref:HAD family hydrolase n=1 Tax=Streptomyces aureoverticillatus TaxID=66871 RepID=UPI0013DC998F|nr:HAD hydrolase-like protein [Streptomyces aureoverticillatus]QIB42666.1 HAD family hydrolase [Streptomyces aureoverticillatus]